MQPGRYVLAVSGGVDSMVLLDILASNPQVHLIVAHYDHGIRSDSAEDRRLVQQIAKQHNVPFVYDEGYLGTGASEATARRARYEFLYTICRQTHARAIITAHHEDDALETAILNMLRGTGRKGLSSLGSNGGVVRPLLHVSKEELVQYAKDNNLQWREDSTNQDTAYKRNYVRHTIITTLTTEQRKEMLAYLAKLQTLNETIDREIIHQLHTQPSNNTIDRRYFNRLPHAVALEVLASWLRGVEARDFDAKGLHRMVVLAKTKAKGSVIDVNYKYVIEVGQHDLALKLRDR